AEAIELQDSSVAYAEDKDNLGLPLLNVFARELREPLAVIIGHIVMLRNGNAGEMNAAQDRALRIVLQQSMWLLRIMNAFFQSLDPQTESISANQSERAYRDNWTANSTSPASYRTAASPARSGALVVFENRKQPPSCDF